MENLSKRVKELRTTLGLNVSEFAKKMDIRHQNIAIIEAGTSKPGAEILSKISETFGVNLNWLVNGEGEMFKNGVTPEIATPIKVKEVKIIPEIEKSNAGFLEKQIQWLQGLVDKLQRENELLIAK